MPSNGHRYLIVSWIFLGILVALVALAFSPEPEVGGLGSRV